MQEKALNVIDAHEEPEARSNREDFSQLPLEDFLKDRRIETYKAMSRALGEYRKRVRDMDSLLWQGPGIDWSALGSINFTEDQRLLDELKALSQRMADETTVINRLEEERRLREAGL